MTEAQNLIQRGWQLHQQDQLSQAETLYRNAVSKEPGNANAWCYLGMALHDRKQYESAAKAYEQALAIQPSFPIALNNYGNTLRYLSKFDKAEASVL